jgi:hypothetical protein
MDRIIHRGLEKIGLGTSCYETAGRRAERWATEDRGLRTDTD